MNYWIIRKDAPSIRMEEGKLNFSILSERVPSIREKDKLVYLNEAKKFQYFAEVSAIEKEYREEKNVTEKSERDFSKIPRIETKVMVSDIQEISEPVDVSDASYSLFLVRNLEKPEVHFRLGYRSLPKLDYETIKEEKIFLARTSYYSLLFALPATLRARFEAQILVAESIGKYEKTFEDRLRRLYKFIQERVISVGDSILNLDILINNLGIKGENSEEVDHRFFDDSQESNYLNKKGDSISVQARLFEEFQEAFAGLPDQAAGTYSDVVVEILGQINLEETRAIEREFEKLFGGRL